MRRGALFFVATVLLSACSKEPQAPAGSVLTIVSPHNDFIQSEFANTFRAWHKREFGEDVQVKFQQRGGTAEVVRYIVSEFEARRTAGQADAGIGVDLMFGGGIAAALRLKEAGCTVPVTVPEEVLAGQPATLGGIRLRDPEGHWYGNVLTAFGIVYNKKALAGAGLAEPKTWTDLASADYFGRVILADPNKSSSISVCFELVLQKYGWERGWATLMRIAANTREFKPSSSQVAPDVAQGVGFAGMSIAFYGHSQIAKSGADVVGYVSPVGATAVTPDPIVMLRGSKAATLAARFVTFTLTEPGQALWALPAGTPDGPKTETLFRIPAVPGVYEKYGPRMVVQVRPFSEAATFEYDTATEARRRPLIGPLFSAAFLKNLDLSRRAWRAVINSGYDAAMVAEFERTPFTEEEGLQLGQVHKADSRRALELDQQWYAFFREKYERILATAKR